MVEEDWNMLYALLDLTNLLCLTVKYKSVLVRHSTTGWTPSVQWPALVVGYRYVGTNTLSQVQGSSSPRFQAYATWYPRRARSSTTQRPKLEIWQLNTILQSRRTILLSITNKIQRYKIFFIIVNAVHVSGGFSAAYCCHTTVWFITTYFYRTFSNCDLS